MKKILLVVIIFISRFSIAYSQCTQPSVVSITAPAIATYIICQGTPQALAGTVTVTAAAQNTDFTYSWIKAGSTPATDVVLQTATIQIPTNTSTAIPNYTGITGMLNDAGKYILRIEDGTAGDASCFRDDTLTLIVNPLTTPGSISAAQTICNGNNPAAFTQTTAATGGNGVVYYGWEKSVNAGAYTDIPSATNSTYDEGILTNSGTTSMTIDYRRKVFDGVCPPAASAPIRITVNPAVVSGVIEADQTICSGGNPVAFTQTSATTGGTDVYTYQWESSVVPFAAWTNIAGATSVTYDPPAGITATTYYRRKDASGICASANTNAVTVTIAAPLVPGTIAADQTICYNTAPAAFTSMAAATGGNGTFAYQWETSVVAGGPYTNIASATNATYTETSLLTADRYYRRKVISGTVAPCNVAYSNIIHVTLTPVTIPTVTITADKTTICNGTSVTFTATSVNGGTPTYMWQKNGVAISPTASNSTYTSTSVENGDTYYVHITSTAACASPVTVTSNAIVMTVASVVTPSVSIAVSPTNTICAGTILTFTANTENGGTAPAYEWFINNVSQGATSTTSQTFTSSTLANGDQVRVTMTSNSAPGTATSNAIPITVSQTQQPLVTITSNPTTICTNNSTTFTATPFNGGTAPIYEWFINNVSQGAPSSSAIFSTSALTSNADVVKVVLTSNSGCGSPSIASANISITVNTGIGGGTIGSDQTICYNTIPAAITEITAPINIIATPMYTWEASLVNYGLWVAIPGATNATYTPTVAITQDVYIRRVTTDPGTPAPCNVATSNVVHIIVRPQLAAGTISSDETICTGTAASTITETASPTGGTGSFTYQWESSVQSGGPYANILNATNSSYHPGVLNVTTYYRRIETSGSCGSLYSNEIAKTVSGTISTITIDDPGQACDGDIALFKSQATNVGLTPIYNWYVNNNLIGSISSTSSNYNIFEPLKSGDEVWVELLSSNACVHTSSVISNKVIVDLVPCTVSNSIYTTNNVPILLQQYVSNSIPNVIEYTYFWSMTGGSITTPIITGPNPITPGQQNVVYGIPTQTGLTYNWSITGGTIVSGQNTNAVTVDWDEAVSSPTAQISSNLYSISVTITNQANHTNTSTLDVHTITTAVKHSQAQSGIKLFPNPTTGSFNIEMPESGIYVTYDILDLTGLSVASGTFTSTGTDETISADLDAGIYQIVLKYNNTVTCVRLSKIQ